MTLCLDVEIGAIALSKHMTSTGCVFGADHILKKTPHTRLWTSKGRVRQLDILEGEGDLRHVIRICGTGTHCLGHIYKQRLVKWHK